MSCAMPAIDANRTRQLIPSALRIMCFLSSERKIWKYNRRQWGEKKPDGCAAIGNIQPFRRRICRGMRMYGRPEAYVLTSGYIVSDVLGSRICLKGLFHLRSRCERKAVGEPQVNA